MISFVTPTFNRQYLVCETIDSILEVLTCYRNIEIIVVDDASVDNTIDLIKFKYKKYIVEGLIKIVALHENIGVTGAKNIGAKHASGEWIVFLDSDDLLVCKNFGRLIAELTNNATADVIFFSCEDFYGNRIGDEFISKKLEIDEYLDYGTFGEKLPVIKKEVILEIPYYSRLRGFEGLTYLNMLLNNKEIYLNNLVCRKYRIENSDRLSSFKGRIKRSHLMSKGFYKQAELLHSNQRKVPLKTLLKIPAYNLLSIINKALRFK